MSDSPLRSRRTGKLAYVLLQGVPWSVGLGLFFVATKVIYDRLVRGIEHEWTEIIGGGIIVVALIAVVAALWLSLKWERRAAAQRLDQSDLF